ncbi:hypothetical protein EYF80_066816 [Liparis tanakae]|uniref:Uncharacterized protein n=1 Tax=Liparis tanakae TaxID=230148 RepID=A0A4Z2E2U5_9TELE|nr:hypothetical protein EYF80_066816 [Liparis tanakae]
MTPVRQEGGRDAVPMECGAQGEEGGGAAMTSQLTGLRRRREEEERGGGETSDHRERESIDN